MMMNQMINYFYLYCYYLILEIIHLLNNQLFDYDKILNCLFIAIFEEILINFDYLTILLSEEAFYFFNFEMNYLVLLSYHIQFFIFMMVLIFD